MRIPFAFVFLLVAFASAQTPAWVARSNQNAQLLLNLTGRYSPEDAGSLGINGLDEQITIPAVDRPERLRTDLEGVRKQLEAHLATEQDPLVKQDLEILIAAATRNLHESEANQRLLLPYRNVAGTVFFGVRSLLDDQVAPERHGAALVRLRKYTGEESGFTPITILAEKSFREKAKNPALLGPSKANLEKDLSDTNAYVNGIGLLFEKYKIKGYQDSYKNLRQQLADYDKFVREEVMPRARADFRLPPELYTLALAGYGVDYTPGELTRLAHEKFNQWQAEMQQLATKIANERNLPSSDYRDVIRTLKKDQIPGAEIMAHYRKRLADIEEIIRREHLITLPDRPAIIRLASSAETAAQPAPHMDPPRLLHNHGERGEFVLPLEATGGTGEPLKYDDFTFAAASWTLTAHEARPGHELQFDAMIERGVSLARAIFAFNSVNVEGWGLYSEWFLLPYMPDDGKLISLQFRLLRAARAFLDPELQQGKITPEQAMRTLENDVVTSEAFANEEVERFTFRSPGQAVSYFDGFMRLRNLRADVERELGPQFNAQRFHDFILSEGLLPPNVLRRAVVAKFTKTPDKPDDASRSR